MAYGNRVEHDGSENKAMLYSLQTEISSSNSVKEKTMSFVEEKSNEKFLKRSYRINQVKTIEDAVTWISSIRKKDSISTGYIYLADTTNNADRTNDSVRLNADISLNALQKSVNERFVDWILLFGEYDKHPIVFGVNLSKMMVYVLIIKDDPADIDSIEESVFCDEDRKIL